MLFWNASEHFWTKLFRLLLQSLNNVCARRLLQILWERAAQLSMDCGTFDLGLLFNLSIPRSFEILTFDAGSLFVSTTISWHDRIFFFFSLWYGFWAGCSVLKSFGLCNLYTNFCFTHSNNFVPYVFDCRIRFRTITIYTNVYKWICIFCAALGMPVRLQCASVVPRRDVYC